MGIKTFGFWVVLRSFFAGFERFLTGFCVFLVLFETCVFSLKMRVICQVFAIRIFGGANRAKVSWKRFNHRLAEISTDSFDRMTR